MAETGLDVDALRRDRDRYQAMLANAGDQIKAWSERAESVQQAIDAIDRLIATTAVRRATATANAPSKTATTPKRKAPTKSRAVAAGAPKGTDAVSTVLAAAPDRAYTLAELVAELSARRWLGPSRRPEELVRINLKRLVERGGALRTDDGRWQAAAEADHPEEPPTKPTAAANPFAGSTTRPTEEQPRPVGGSVREW